jgi:hypothetical protein
VATFVALIIACVAQLGISAVARLKEREDSDSMVDP